MADKLGFFERRGLEKAIAASGFKGKRTKDIRLPSREETAAAGAMRDLFKRGTAGAKQTVKRAMGKK